MREYTELYLLTTCCIRNQCNFELIHWKSWTFLNFSLFLIFSSRDWHIYGIFYRRPQVVTYWAGFLIQQQENHELQSEFPSTAASTPPVTIRKFDCRRLLIYFLSQSTGQSVTVTRSRFRLANRITRVLCIFCRLRCSTSPVL